MTSQSLLSRAWWPCRVVAPPRGVVFATIAMFSAGCVTTRAHAADHDTAVIVQAGQGDRADHTVAIGYTRGFTRLDGRASSSWSFYGEAVVGEWFVNNAPDGQRKTFTQLSLSPVVRYDLGRSAGHAFVDVGIGVSAIVPRFIDHGRRFSTAFNFDDHASLGYRFGDFDADEITIRAEHFSNGGIRNPNPGQNFASLRYARHF